MKSSRKKITIPDKSSIIAQCRLSNIPVEDRVSILTPFWTYFILRKKSWRFENENISHISIGHHRLMGPLIIGGLIACFSIILISRNEFDPFVLLVIFVAGLVLLYHGWLGSPAITVKEKNDTTVIYIREIPTAFRSFLNFHRNYLNKSNEAMSIFHIASSKDWEKSQSEYEHGSLEKENFIHASTRNQVIPTFSKHFPDEGDFTLLEIEIPKLTNEVKYEYVSDRDELFPHIYGSINKSAVARAIAFRNAADLKAIMLKL